MSNAENLTAKDVASPVVIAFATQKGGLGKSTLTVLVASYLHYRRGISTAIIDVDTSQLSIYNQRLREINDMEQDEDMKVRLDQQRTDNKEKVDAYPILSGSPLTVEELLTDLPEDVQLVLLDMPGSIDVEGYDLAISQVDLLIVPMETSEYSITTGFQFLEAIKDSGLLPLENCRVVWNRYKQTRDADLVDQLEERFKDYGFECLKSRVPHRDSYQDMNNRSTLFPMPTNYLRNSGLKELFYEVEDLIKSKQHERINR
ncbi:ParA family protein [Larkinella insperata]|uniref:ParA family protein n=1 Tax=Larkinella insperata TaxID=332158 RepID=A0ABW3QI11_9BACT